MSLQRAREREQNSNFYIGRQDRTTRGIVKTQKSFIIPILYYTLIVRHDSIITATGVFRVVNESHYIYGRNSALEQEFANTDSNAGSFMNGVLSTRQ